jgi:2-oxoglutarate ferredoxin oxidoreductase subunit delta
MYSDGDFAGRLATTGRGENILGGASPVVYTGRCRHTGATAPVVAQSVKPSADFSGSCVPRVGIPLALRANPCFSVHPTSGVTMIKGTIQVATDLCKGCELCVAACPQSCIGLSSAFNARGYRFATLTAETCTGCAACALVCPDSALTVLRQARDARAA